MNNSNYLDSIEASLSAVIRIAKRPGYWEELQKKSNLSIDRPAAAILIILSQKPSNFQTLVSRLGVEPPSVSRKVHELESKGLIKRRPTEDKRVHELDLSSEGLTIANKLLAAKRSMYKEVLKSWGDKDIEDLSRMLDKLVNNMQERFENKGVKS